MTRVDEVRKIVGDQLAALDEDREVGFASSPDGESVRLSMGNDMDERFEIIEPTDTELAILAAVVRLLAGKGKQAWSRPTRMRLHFRGTVH